MTDGHRPTLVGYMAAALSCVRSACMLPQAGVHWLMLIFVDMCINVDVSFCIYYFFFLLFIILIFIVGMCIRTTYSAIC